MQVTVDMRKYEKEIREDAAQRATEIRHRPPPVETELVNRARKFLGPTMPHPGTPNWAREVDILLDAKLTESLAKKKNEGLLDIIDLQDNLLVLGRDPEEDARDVENRVEGYVQQAMEVAKRFEHTLREAVGRVAVWGGSPVRATPRGSMSSYGVKVGDGDAGFTVFMDDDGERIDSVDDVLEGGDSDFFDDPQEQADYFNLVKELRHPGSSARGKDIVLWTARPVKDRERYEHAHTIPPNIFMTTDPDRAYGLAQEGELGGGIRDVWRVVVNEAHLVLTLESGRIKDYQVVGSKPIPVKSIRLDMPAPETASTRVAARWRSAYRT